ncbi:MAG: single-stranded-DNA-specific exonuclease RecJ [Clostridia bacterium]|nr:single-stranded-DNA-specific exonuclease RecJ [Clostridia bacterium]
MYLKNKWAVTATHKQMQADPTVREIAQELGIRLPTAQLLFNRGCTTPKMAVNFLSKKEEQIHDPFIMKDMRAGASRIVDAVRNGEKIVIFGDYDVDGVTSVSCLYLYLSSIGANVSYYIPCRSGEGYGMSENAIRNLAEDGCQLIITVDTGITASYEVGVARELGVDVVVTDHHECHAEIPSAVAVINPRQPDCPYPFKELAGVGVVFKVLCAVESLLNPTLPLVDCVRKISHRYCDLVAIGTVADVMPIADENRLIVNYGLSLIENTERPGLCALIGATRSESKYNTKRKVTSSFIGFTIVPRINAAGRIRDASIAVELLLSKDMETAEPIAKTLCDINHERQEEENNITDEAYAKITESHDFDRDPVIVLDDSKWHHGIIGIVASRITEKYGCPSILISFEGSEDGEIGKGSGRSVKGLNLVEVLGKCGDLLEKFGGHELAAGLTIKKENLEEFKRRLNDCARECLAAGGTETVLEAECELVSSDITMDQVNEIYYLEPFGTANPVPTFVLYGVDLYDTALVGGGKHTRLTIKIGRSYVTAMCFRQTLDELDIYPGDTVDIMFTLDINEYQNQKNLQMIVKDVRLTNAQLDSEEAEREVYASVKAGNPLSTISGSISPDHIIPTRDDFGAVYSVMKRELRVEHEIFSIRALLHLMKSHGYKIGYVKMKFILATFSELNILNIKKIDEEREIYAFKYVFMDSKTNLDKSNIYRKLKADYGQK